MSCVTSMPESDVMTTWPSPRRPMSHTRRLPGTFVCTIHCAFRFSTVLIVTGSIHATADSPAAGMRSPAGARKRTILFTPLSLVAATV